MKQSYLITVFAFVLILVGVIYFGVSSGDKDVVIEPPVVLNDDETRPEVTLTAKHQFKEGIHTIAGVTDMPTPCHLLDWETLIAESFPEQVTINFSLTTQADMCAQVVTPTRFKIEFQASEEASIRATLNGKDVVLNLIEAEPGEDLDDFELFIKG